MDQNQHQNKQIVDLENELALTKEEICNLKYEISRSKKDLQIYLKHEEDEDEELNESSFSNLNETTQLISQLEKRVGSLETENQRLSSETEKAKNELQSEECKELQLIDECARRLSIF